MGSMFVLLTLAGLHGYVHVRLTVPSVVGPVLFQSLGH